MDPMNRVFILGQKSLTSLLLGGLLLSPLQVFAQEASTSVSIPPPENATTTTAPTETSSTEQPTLTEQITSPPASSGVTESVPSTESAPVDSETSLLGGSGPMSLMSTSDPQPIPDSLTQFTYQNPAQIEQFTGALTKKIQLVVPPGRKGMQPDLALEYNSQKTQDGIVGYGWTVSIPYIERLNKTGSERLYTDNYFTSSLGGELATTSLATSSPIEYRHKTEDGSFIKYFYSGTSWVAYDKNGVRYTFGTTSQARQTDPGDSTHTYKWMLEEVRDTNDNFVRYEYASDSNQIYPSKIYYTGHNTTDGIFTVDFTRSSRPDTVTSYKSGFEVQTAYRITEVKMSVNSQWVRKYTLSYTTGSNGYRSLLQGVQLTGRDDQGTELSYPATTFQYASSTTSLFLGPNATRPITSPALVVGDRNGDGLNDITVSYGDPDTNQPSYRFWTNRGLGSFDYTTETNSTLVPEVWGGYYTNGTYSSNGQSSFRILDVNGDGKIDIALGQKDDHVGSTTVRFHVNNFATSTGYGWTETISTTTSTSSVPLFGYVTPSGTDVVSTGLLGNFNGDAYPDYSVWLSDPNWKTGPISYVGNGENWTVASTSFTAQKEMIDSARNYMYNNQAVDVNGDGLDDWVYSDSSSTKVCINTGSQWEDTCNSAWNLPFPTLYASPNTTSPPTYYDRGMRFMDINGDGLPDFVRAYKHIAHTYDNAPTTEVADTKLVLLNTGNGWATSTELSAALPAYITTAVVTGDIWSGVFEFDEYANWEGNGQKLQDVITHIAYPQGGYSDIVYASTTKQLGTNPELPVALLVVEKITTNDGNGSGETTTFGYGGGKMYLPSNPLERKLAGFASSTATTGQSRTTTYYHQGDSPNTPLGEQADGFAYIGKPYRVDITDASTTATLQKTYYKYDVFNQGDERNFIYKALEMVQSFGTSTAHKDWATEFSYATTTGDVTQTVERGEVTGASDGTYTDTGTDTRIRDISYAVSTSTNISVPVQETFVNSASTTLKETKYYYDSLPFGEVSLGNSTKKERWITGSTYASSTQSYNTYGLVASSTDARGATTTYAFETNNIYVASTTDALGHVTGAVYDFATGKIKASYDPNNLSRQYLYDPLGRLTEEKEPDVSNPASLVTKSTITYTDNTFPTNTQQTSYLNSATTTGTYTYFDGLGRPIQEKKQGEANYITTDHIYNNLGLVGQESLPYVSTSTAWTAPTTTSQLFVVKTYDSLKRPAAVVTAVGTTSYAYGPWTTEATNALGVIKTLIKDAYGNLSEVVENNDTDTYHTTYTYDLNDNLTKITDALGNIRNFAYDGLSRRTSAEDLHASGDGTYGTYTYSYDDNGNEISRTDPKSQTITHSYDAVNRVLTEDYIGASGTEVSYVYDSCTYGIGQLCVASSTGSRTTYNYNPLGLAGGATTTIQGTDYGMNYVYDRQGNVASYTNPDGSQVAYTYYPGSLLAQTSKKEAGSGSWSMVTTHSNYSPIGEAGSVLFGSGLYATRTYEETELYRLTHLSLQASTTQVLTPLIDLSYLVVGGGGNGGQASASGAGGGGGGGVLVGTKSNVTVGNYSVVVGAGGAGNGAQNNGQSSTFDTITASGGGAGGSQNYDKNGQNGGSGGGAEGRNGGTPGSGTSGQGYDGGYGVNTGNTNTMLGGGGGGAGALGGDANDGTNTGGVGGDGVSSSITGTSTTYGGGGGGGGGGAGGSGGTGGAGGGGNGGTGNSVGSAGVANTGGGGGGAHNQTGSTNNGGAGGSGIVVISAPTGAITATGGTYATSSGNDIWTFTSSGTFSVTAINSPSTTTSTTEPIGQVFQDVAYTYDAVGNIINIVDTGSSTPKNIDFFYDDLNRLASASSSIYTSNYTYNAIGNLLNKTEGTSTGSGGGANTHSWSSSRNSLQYASASDSASISPTGDMTIEAWVKFDTLPGITNTILGKWGDITGSAPASASSFIFFSNYGNSLGLAISNGTTADGVSVSWSPSTGVWYHVAAVYSSGSVDFYVNGSLLGSASGLPTSINDSSVPMLVGQYGNAVASGNDYRYYIDGKLDDVRLWDTARSSTDIANDMSTQLIGNETHLKAYYQLNNDYTDTTGNGNTLTAVNSPTFSTAVPFVGDTGAPTYVYSGTGYANPHAPTDIASTTLTYDNNGNVTAFGTTTYAWDYANRLTSVGNGISTSTYTYAHNEQRVTQTVASTTTFYPNKYYSVTQYINGATTTATTTSYIYAGNDLVATIDQVYINGSATGTPTTHYIHPDHLGSTNLVTDASGQVVQTLDYYPYGTLRTNESVGGANEGRKYIGQYQDDTSGLSYLNARYYSGNTGQFLSEDPVHLAIGSSDLERITGKRLQEILADPQVLNSYSYARNNPIANKDPEGNLPILAAIGWGLTALGIIDIGFSGYDTYLTNFKYPQVFSDKEKQESRNQLWISMATAGLPSAGSLAGVLKGRLGEVTADVIVSLTNSLGQLPAPQYQRNQTPTNSFIGNYNNNLSQSYTQTVNQFVQSYNISVGATAPESKLWTTPNGSVINWSGQVIVEGSTNSKK